MQAPCNPKKSPFSGIPPLSFCPRHPPPRHPCGTTVLTVRHGHTLPLTLTTEVYLRVWGRPGFDGGSEAAQGVSRVRYLVNPPENQINANDERFALAA